MTLEQLVAATRARMESPGPEDPVHRSPFPCSFCEAEGMAPWAMLSREHKLAHSIDVDG